jgi:hypothetical protein
MKEDSDKKLAFPPPPKTDVPQQKEHKAIATKLIFFFSGSIKLCQQDLFPIYTAIDAVKFSNCVVNVGI